MLEEKTPYMNRWKKLLNIWESEAKYWEKKINKRIVT
jgi:hypothetical protein